MIPTFRHYKTAYIILYNQRKVVNLQRFLATLLV